MRRSFLIRLVLLVVACGVLASGSVAQRVPEPLRLSAPLPGMLGVTSVEGIEGLSRLFRFEIEISPVAARSSFDALLGQELTLTMTQRDGTVRHFSGICNRISQARVGGMPVLRLQIVPKMWLLTKQSGSRMFQDLSIPEIIEQVLQDHGIQAEFLLQSSYPTRDCVTQYRESDFAFISRLMEEEGIFYFFTHQADGHILVVSGPPGTHPDIPGESVVTFDRGDSGKNGLVHEWEKTQELRSGSVTLRDHSFGAPENPLEAQAVIQERVAAGEVTHRLRSTVNASLELYDYPGAYAQRFDGVTVGVGQLLDEGRRTAEIRMQQEAVNSVMIDGASTHSQLTAGHRFTLENHIDANGDYVLTSVQHAARVSRGASSMLEYSNTFTCIPAGLPYAPEQSTPKPVIAGVHPATVAGPAGEEIHTDGNGRVKVSFPWDRDTSGDESSSCWIRVLAASSELPRLPEIGSQVLVSFVEGDPDRPIVVGSIPNSNVGR